MSLDAYDAFASRVVEGGVLADPWLAGRPRFREEPTFVTEERHRALSRAAEDVAAVYEETCRIVEAAPELLDEFFGLTRWQKAMWIASAPLWHGIARADVFVADDGLAIAELNCDTPTGEAEAVLLNRVVAAAHPNARDPNVHLEERFGTMVEALWRHLVVGEAPRAVGLVYPTEFTEDLAVIRLYRDWLEARGFEVVLGSPYNLERSDTGVRLFDTDVSIVLRHYKTDWWGERTSAWDDEEIEDRAALEEPLRALFDAMLDHRVAVINPFGAVLPQNKRAMAFMWEHIHRFSPWAQDVIRRYVPPTQRLERLHEAQLLAQKDEWVLKSDYGAEGDEVVIGRDVTAEVFRETIAHARPGRFVAQRFFRAEVDGRGEITNYGVFLVAGEACGLYTRTSSHATDEQAVSTPALVVP